MVEPPQSTQLRADIADRLALIERERAELVAKLAALDRVAATARVSMPPVQLVGTSMASSTTEKITLFRSLFRGRDDVFPRRWENVKSAKSGYAPACNNEWVPRICAKPRVKCSDCPNQAFTPFDDAVVRAHLLGRAPKGTADFTAGVYALLPDERCWFLAADFDKKCWQQDVAAFRDAARSHDIPVAIERSRSGNGAHAWIFFAEPVPAADARRLGALLVTLAMDSHPDLGFDSYDRFFPSQDTMPAGGFGNLIALPLQNGPRKKGNSAFVDDAFNAHPDQWAFLAAMERVTRTVLDTVLAQSGDILRIRLPSMDEDDEPWTALPSRRQADMPIVGAVPRSVDVVLGNQIYVDRRELPPALVNRIARLAAFQNP